MKTHATYLRSNTAVLALATLVLFGASLAASAAEAGGKSGSGAQAADNPDWIIVEDYWYPLRLEPAAALSNASCHYRRGEERAAANDVRKAVSWLRFAEGHALPITKEKLAFSERELTALANDISAGRISAAARLDPALARASHALAEYHFFRAKDSLGRNDTEYAAQDLEAAVTHLRNAAASAHYQFGPDTIQVFDDVLRDGTWVDQRRTIDNNMIGKHLDAVEKAVRTMANTIEASSD